MTTAIVVMIGAGILFVISAIEDSSLIATFQVIWGGQPISSLAAGSSGTQGKSTRQKRKGIAPPGTLPPGVFP